MTTVTVDTSIELQWRKWRLLDIAVLIAVGIQHKTTSAVLFTLLFKYFDPVSDQSDGVIVIQYCYCHIVFRITC